MQNLFETMPDFTCNHDMRRCVVNGKEMFFTDERIASKDVPNGLYKADVRSSDFNAERWSTIEPIVVVNHCGTLISDEPFVYDKHFDRKHKVDPYIEVEDYEIEYDPDLD